MMRLEPYDEISVLVRRRRELALSLSCEDTMRRWPYTNGY